MADADETDHPSDASFPLPIDIAFLARHGVAIDDLQMTANRARRLGVDPARELIASRVVDEATFYRALASELGLPFHDGRLALAPGGEHASTLRAGIASIVARPGNALRFALAPTGAALRCAACCKPARAGVAISW